MTDEHTSPIKTPRQLIIVVLLAFAVPITLAVLVSQLVTSGEKGMGEDDSMILSRIQPVGNVVLAEASGPKGALTGEQVYDRRISRQGGRHAGQRRQRGPDRR